MTQQSLVSISEASQILGVSEGALRQWTDEGKIKAFITPGGHRRYSTAELKKFITSHQKTLGIKDLVAELENTARLHREIARNPTTATAWCNTLCEEAQEHLADLGRRLLKVIIAYITEPSRREENVKLAHAIGHDHGETLAKLGIPLTDSIEAFILHRNPIMKATTQLMKKRETLNDRVLDAIPLVVDIMDDTLVSLVASHQQLQSNFYKAEGGTPSDINFTPTL